MIPDCANDDVRIDNHTPFTVLVGSALDHCENFHIGDVFGSIVCRDLPEKDICMGTTNEHGMVKVPFEIF